MELMLKRLGERPGVHRHSRPSPYAYFPNGGFIIE